MHKINLKDSKVKITKELNKMHALDIVKYLRTLEENEQKYILELIPIDKVDDVFLELTSKEAFNYFINLDLVRQKTLLTELSASDLKELFLEFNEEEKAVFYNLITEEKHNELTVLLKYASSDAASFMQNEFLTLKETYTVTEAMRYIVKEVHDTDYIDTIFVVDDENTLIGNVFLKELIVARKKDDFKNLINKDIIFVYDNESLDIVTNKISNYDLNIIPVVNQEKKLLGVINADEIFENLALKHESNVDKFVAVGDYDEQSGPFRRAMQRFPWLLISIVLNLVIALFLSIFSETIDTVKALILFQPMILGMAGNIGMQSIAVTIVELHLNKDLSNEAMKKHTKKEVSIGLLNSILIAIAGFVLAFVFLELFKFDQNSNIPSLAIAISISLSLLLSMFLAAIFGVIIPLTLNKLKVDPAVASGPIISTINDLVALFIYFGIATIMINLLI
ncbi:MAG TPA: magnesium transporter [Acholeplasmataceae bacterium]|nr:magnesium transporter [Acholeplasmataceae bacterium]